jgi:hypothetical protein
MNEESNIDKNETYFVKSNRLYYLMTERIVINVDIRRHKNMHNLLKFISTHTLESYLCFIQLKMIDTFDIRRNEQTNFFQVYKII